MCDPFANDDPGHVGLEWVRARLRQDPRTRPLGIRARAVGQTLVLEGQVGSLADRQVAEVVARRSQHQGWLDNRIVVVESNASACALPWLRSGPPKSRLSLAG